MYTFKYQNKQEAVSSAGCILEFQSVRFVVHDLDYLV